MNTFFTLSIKCLKYSYGVINRSFMVDVFLGMEMISLQMMTSEGKIIKIRVQRTPFHPPPPWSSKLYRVEVVKLGF